MRVAAPSEEEVLFFLFIALTSESIYRLEPLDFTIDVDRSSVCC